MGLRERTFTRRTPRRFWRDVAGLGALAALGAALGQVLGFGVPALCGAGLGALLIARAIWREARGERLTFGATGITSNRAEPIAYETILSVRGCPRGDADVAGVEIEQTDGRVRVLDGARWDLGGVFAALTDDVGPVLAKRLVQPIVRGEEVRFVHGRPWHRLWCDGDGPGAMLVIAAVALFATSYGLRAAGVPEGTAVLAGYATTLPSLVWLVRGLLARKGIVATRTGVRAHGDSIDDETPWQDVRGALVEGDSVRIIVTGYRAISVSLAAPNAIALPALARRLRGPARVKIAG